MTPRIGIRAPAGAANRVVYLICFFRSRFVFQAVLQRLLHIAIPCSIPLKYRSLPSYCFPFWFSAIYHFVYINEESSDHLYDYYPVVVCICIYIYTHIRLKCLEKFSELFTNFLRAVNLLAMDNDRICADHVSL